MPLQRIGNKTGMQIKLIKLSHTWKPGQDKCKFEDLRYETAYHILSYISPSNAINVLSTYFV